MEQIHNNIIIYKSEKYSTAEWIELANKKHNNKYDYSEVDYKNAKTKVIIICNEHGKFEQNPNSHNQGFGCAKCTNKYNPKYTTSEWIEVANKKHNNKYDYSKIKYKNYNENLTIICKIHGEFSQIAKNHLCGSGCAECNKQTKQENMPLENSFFSKNEKSKFWSPKNELSPKNVIPSSKQKFMFDCNVCNHEFMKAPYKVQKGGWCPYCANTKLCSNENCTICFEKSFASSDKSSKWSKENKCAPRDVFKSSGNKYLFKCNKCNHDYYSSLDSINRNISCSYCNHQSLCDDNNCHNCFKNSFASNKLSKYWSKKNNIEPRMCFKSANKKFIFDCPHCNNEYTSSLNHISNNCWCNCTVNKTETKLFEYLQKEYDMEISKQKSFLWCKNIQQLPFDFVIEELKLIIELDGDQHFVPVKYFKSDPILQQQTDKYKMKCANANGYTVIRIVQEDVWKDKSEWKEDLKEFIKKYDKPKRIYIGDIYDGTFYNCDKPLIDNKN